jgi:hypothetical protein
VYAYCKAQSWAPGQGAGLASARSDRVTDGGDLAISNIKFLLKVTDNAMFFCQGNVVSKVFPVSAGRGENRFSDSKV